MKLISRNVRIRHMDDDMLRKGWLNRWVINGGIGSKSDSTTIKVYIPFSRKLLTWLSELQQNLHRS